MVVALVVIQGVAFGQKKTEKETDTLKIKLSQWELTQLKDFDKSTARENDIVKLMESLQAERTLIGEKKALVWGAIYNAHHIEPASLISIISINPDTGEVKFKTKDKMPIK